MSESRVLIRDPENGRQAWFSLPFYFGKLMSIGLSGSYEERIELVDYQGLVYIGLGYFIVEDLEQLNRQVDEY